MKDQIGEIVAEIRESAVCTELTKHPVSVELLHSWADKLEALGGDTEWRTIETHPQYEVSNTGRVRHTDGTELGIWNHRGYRQVRLSQPRAQASVHRLVATAFIENAENKPSVNHIDCDKGNNHYTNLEWCTQAENVRHSKELNRYPENYWKGRRSPNAAFSDLVVEQIRACYKAGNVSQQSLAERYGANKRTINRIVNNQSYKSLIPAQPKQGESNE